MSNGRRKEKEKEKVPPMSGAQSGSIPTRRDFLRTAGVATAAATTIASASAASLLEAQGNPQAGGMPPREEDPRALTLRMEQGIPRPRFAEYSQKFKDWYTMKREDGIIEIALGGEKGRTPNNLNQLFWEVGNDPDNRVMILTAKGEYWFGTPEEPGWQGLGGQSAIQSPMWEYDQYAHFWQRLHILQNLIFDIDFPTIGAINGPGIPGHHSEAALCCDITICTEDTWHWDPHAPYGDAPGDGNGLAYQELLGTKRAAYYLYTREPMDAQTMLQYGMVNEVVPRERLLPRAWEIARRINEMPHNGLTMTKAIVRRPWAQRLVNDAGFHLAHEFFGISNDKEIRRAERGKRKLDRAREIDANYKRKRGK